MFVGNSTLHNNTASTYGGAISLVSGNLVTIIRESSLKFNTAGVAGGAIHSSLQNSGLLIGRSELGGNTALSNNGGAVYIGSDHDNVTFSECIIQHCKAKDGGGIFIGTNNALVTVVDLTLSDNEVMLLM